MTTAEIKAQFDYARKMIKTAPQGEKLGWTKIANGLALILEARVQS
jgi:hypothetical protein